MQYFKILLFIICFSTYAYGINLIPNAGFEKDMNFDSIPDFWNVKKSPTAIYGIEEHGKKGRCVFISGKAMLSCKLKRVKKNKFYLLSFWIKRDGWKEGEYPKVKIFDKEFCLNNIVGWGYWAKMFLLVNSGNNENSSLFLINPGFSYRIYFDEINLREFSPTPIYPCGNIYTYQPEFIWSLPENPYVLRIKIEISRYPDFKTYFVVKDVVSPQKNKIVLDFPIDGGKWFWRIKLYKNRRLIAISKSMCFNVCAFFPIGIYGVPLKYISIVKKAGFNSICPKYDSRRINELFSAASKYDLKILISAGKDFSLLKAIKDFSSILAWYLEDEPEINLIYPLSLWKLKNYIKSIDPIHPTIITLVRADMAEDYGDCADIIMVDPYPVPRRPLTWLSDSIDKVKKLLPYKPVWAVIQAFDWSAFPYGEEKRSWGRDPTYEEERCLTYLAIIHGARGLFYYTFKNKNYFIINRAKHWNEVKAIIKELNRIYPLLIAPKIYPVCSVALANKGKIHYIIKHMPKGFRMKQGYYLLCVNSTPSSVNAEIDLPFDFTLAEDIFSYQQVNILKNRLIINLPPYGVAIYFLKN